MSRNRIRSSSAVALVALLGLVPGAFSQVLRDPRDGQPTPDHVRTAIPEWSFAGAFAAASARVHQPRFRWWWPGATVTDSEIRREIAEIADAGFGGVEIADVYDSVHARIDPVESGWGTARWNAAVTVALDAAATHGLTVDLTIGPHWPAAVPTIVPGDEAAAHELMFGQAVVKAGDTFDGALPEPALKPGGVTKGNPSPQVTNHLLRILAARCKAGCSPEGTITLEAGSVENITARYAGGRLRWAPPGRGEWLVLPIYTRATGQIVNMFDGNPQNSPVTDPQSFVVDSFGKAGTKAIIDYWNNTLLTPEVRRGLARAGGAIFEDSLELKAAQYWTPGLLEEFQRRRGYSIVPYLPILIDGKPRTFDRAAQAAFAFDDGNLAKTVRRDWNRTLAELWQQNHLEPIRDWAKSLGLIFRNQSYGGPLDSILAAATTGQPEGESLGFGKEMIKFRALRAGRDIGGGGLLSDEMGAFLGAYDTTWTSMMLPEINRNFAAGVNQLYIHGYAYADAPEASWPGFSPFGTLFAEPWNSMQPSWRHITDLAGYLARVQMVLQQGLNRTDIAVLRQELDLEGGYLQDDRLLDQGYTVGYLSPATLELPAAFVRNGVLDPNGAAFRAMVVLDAANLPTETLGRLVGFARAGLPIVIVGNATGPAPSPLPGRAGDAQARQLLSNLLALRHVVRTDTQSQLPAVLSTAGIAPEVSYGRPARLRHIHRHADGTDFHYFFNDGDSVEELTVGLAGVGIPWQLDPWSGAVSRLALYEERKGRVELPVRLGPGQTVIIALRPFSHGMPKAPVHVSKAAGDRIIASGDLLVLRATRAGSHPVTRSNGRQDTISVPPLPASLNVSRWSLNVESWEPGDVATWTRKHELPELHMDRLVPWSSIEALRNVSGIGTYRAKITLGPDWADDLGAYLFLGGHSDTVRIRVNGIALAPVDQLADRIDLGHVLKPGGNLVEIELATTLNNVLLSTRPSAFEISYAGPRHRADYGLAGPVRLEPYRDVPIDRRRR